MPELPTECIKVWDVWLDLHLANRNSGINGPNKLGFLDLKAYAEMTGRRLMDWEQKAFFLIEQAYMASVAREIAAANRGK